MLVAMMVMTNKSHLPTSLNTCMYEGTGEIEEAHEDASRANRTALARNHHGATTWKTIQGSLPEGLPARIAGHNSPRASHWALPRRGIRNFLFDASADLLRVNSSLGMRGLQRDSGQWTSIWLTLGSRSRPVRKNRRATWEQRVR
jgi:hypothetical protein